LLALSKNDAEGINFSAFVHFIYQTNKYSKILFI
jgi:hypothetical protein